MSIDTFSPFRFGQVNLHKNNRVGSSIEIAIDLLNNFSVKLVREIQVNSSEFHLRLQN
jgi:hypothetical protein